MGVGQADGVPVRGRLGGAPHELEELGGAHERQRHVVADARFSSAAASRFAVEVRKKCSTASSANDGESATSTTTWAPASASSSPAPVSTSAPESGDAGTASWPCPPDQRTSSAPGRSGRLPR
ncbi:hypothetical protein [Saccharothrix sp. 6-C]|uniref:hypothetical protein n=1 Tax=Saccharothrix sp. 6-C TaxID=2781735 RepID=UPI0019172D57|nr:hypothetical protein [Saccharothrix sp. 6-C]